MVYMIKACAQAGYILLCNMGLLPLPFCVSSPTLTLRTAFHNCRLAELLLPENVITVEESRQLKHKLAGACPIERIEPSNSQTNSTMVAGSGRASGTPVSSGKTRSSPSPYVEKRPVVRRAIDGGGSGFNYGIGAEVLAAGGATSSMLSNVSPREEGSSLHVGAMGSLSSSLPYTDRSNLSDSARAIRQDCKSRGLNSATGKVTEPAAGEAGEEVIGSLRHPIDGDADSITVESLSLSPSAHTLHHASLQVHAVSASTVISVNDILEARASPLSRFRPPGLANVAGLTSGSIPQQSLGKIVQI
jgi:hypothetical protein